MGARQFSHYNRREGRAHEHRWGRDDIFGDESLWMSFSERFVFSVKKEARSSAEIGEGQEVLKV